MQSNTQQRGMGVGTPQQEQGYAGSGSDNRPLGQQIKSALGMNPHRDQTSTMNQATGNVPTQQAQTHHTGGMGGGLGTMGTNTNTAGGGMGMGERDMRVAGTGAGAHTGGGILSSGPTSGTTSGTHTTGADTGTTSSGGAGSAYNVGAQLGHGLKNAGNDLAQGVKHAVQGGTGGTNERDARAGGTTRM